jgi:hypothetical protein
MVTDARRMVCRRADTPAVSVMTDTAAAVPVHGGSARGKTVDVANVEVASAQLLARAHATKVAGGCAAVRGEDRPP